jgi:sigma-B regulation protein RsbU (phosphoserine phosphatase)
VSVGGHPLPILLRADGRTRRFGLGGMLLGVFPGPELFEDSTTLDPGDSIVPFTDGVIDDRTAPDGAEAELRTVLQAHAGRTAEEIIGAVRELVLRRAERRAPDDAAVVVVRVRR